jgi:hypothetical protein
MEEVKLPDWATDRVREAADSLREAVDKLAELVDNLQASQEMRLLRCPIS